MGNCVSEKQSGDLYQKERKFVNSQATLQDLKKTYDIIPKVLGSGAFSKVFKASDKKDGSMEIAIKVINKDNLTPDLLESLINEVTLIQQVDHPNIVKYYETYDDKKYIYLCMEICTGGQLLEKVTERKKPFTEREAAEVMRDVLKALQHCHAQGIIHRDIKPQNIMYGRDGIIKLIDFGFAIAQQKKRAFMDVCGSPYYIAPEVYTGTYGQECDIWSLGVTLYQLLTGQMPFDGSKRQDIFRKVRKGQFSKPNNLSGDCKDLLAKMITVDKAKRITPIQALQHQWFKIIDDKSVMKSMSKADQQELDRNVVQRMQSYRGQSLLKRAAVNILVKHLEASQIEKLKEMFQKIDLDHNGFLEVTELEQFIRDCDFKMGQKQVQKIIKELDFAENKRVNYSEFIAATINLHDFLSEQRLQAIFNQFDIDNTGQISKENLKQAFSKYGRDISDTDIDTILKKHDRAGDEAISFHEFKTMLLD